MTVLSWVSIALLLLSMALYLYWSWREDRARPAWIRRSFYGGVAAFSLLFVALTVHTLAVVPERTHAQDLTPEVVAGKQAWHKYVCINCHTLVGNGAYFAPELMTAWNRFLDRAGGDPKAAEAAMVRFLQNPPRATSGRRGMPQHDMPAAEAANLVAFLRWTSRIDTNGWPPPPVYPIAAPAALRSAIPDSPGKTLFAEHCSACHSIGGGAGAGPDLAGIASRSDRAAILNWISDPEAVYKQRGRKPLNATYGEMPDPGVGEQDAQAIAAFLLEGAKL